MNSKRLIVCAALLVAGIVALPMGEAAPPCRVCQKQVAVIQETAIVPVVSNIFYPLYTAQYQPGPSASADGNAELLRALLAEIKALRQDIRSPNGPGVPVPEAVADPLAGMKASALAVANNRCAACHTEATAGKKGGGFVLLTEGGFAKLDAAKALNVLDRIWETNAARAMPKGGTTLADKELGELSGWLHKVR